ncbi:MAG: amidophosphoribosyltransferase [Saprospiraceae bacterium]
MSDQIKHECGIAVIRLLKPLSFYQEKYGTAFYGLLKLQWLMQKQRNRGQDGAGLATIKIDPIPGERYISRRRSNSSNYLQDLFEGVYSHFSDCTPEQLLDSEWLKDHKPYTGELLLGHLRYGTHGLNTIETCHPFLRQNNWISRNLVMAGNFNLTNVDELFEELIELGQFPKEHSDTVTVMEKIGHFLDQEVQSLFDQFKGNYDNIEINRLIFENLDVQKILAKASRKFDGGYAIAGLIGHGDAFVMRDPNGIRPVFWYADDEIAVVASEKPAIQTVFNTHFREVKEIQPGHALIIKRSGQILEVPFTEPKEKTSCSFERIYFSRGNDREIYEERKSLGSQLARPILESVEYDFDNTVFSFLPNTAESAYFGLMQGLEDELNAVKLTKIQALGPNPDETALKKILGLRARSEKLVVKDEKQRTFITDDAARGGLVSHVYDVTWGLVRDQIDTLVVIDDSIVRGTTLRDSIIKILARLKPKKIIIVSSAPQIRYPDCYGIDMSKMSSFVAFQALVALLRETDQMDLLERTYERCKAQEDWPKEEIKNELIALYDTFPYEMITQKIAEIVTPVNIQPEVELIYQTLEGLHKSCPNHTGDWYFSGKYPTPGGNKVVNRAFINYMEKRDVRAY